MKKLDKISLYAVSALEGGITSEDIPIKEVHFDYDYSLCQNVPNTTSEESGQNGKLTLKRLSKNLRQKDLAKQLNITQTTISSYEIGKLNANRIPLQKICATLTINFYDFLQKHTKPYLSKEIKLPVILDQKLAQFIGYLIGDGSIEKDRITFFEQNKEVALEYKKLFDQYFNLDCSYKFRKSKNYISIKPGPCVAD